MNVQNEDEYEDLLSLWSDLECGLGIILGSPASIQEFEQRVKQYDRWMRALLERDTDLGLYLLFQLAGNSPVGYSASHALVSAVLCHLIAVELKLPSAERNCLVHAALTMNLGMTTLQDHLAGQLERPSPVQQEAIQSHAAKGARMLARLGIDDKLWLETVTLHHTEIKDRGELGSLAPARRLAHILRVVDRYGVMISPRKSREGRTATDSMRTISSRAVEQADEVGQALLSAVGLCPPGTYVRLENEEIAVVVRRSAMRNAPYVAVVVNDAGTMLQPPRLHCTADSSLGIKSALTASAIRERLNHHQILQLGAAAQPN